VVVNKWRIILLRLPALEKLEWMRIDRDDIRYSLCRGGEEVGGCGGRELPAAFDNSVCVMDVSVTK
jgi:hypothetical protein